MTDDTPVPGEEYNRSLEEARKRAAEEDEDEALQAREEARAKEQEEPEVKTMEQEDEPEEAGRLTEDHQTKLIMKYGIPEDRVPYWEGKGVLSSIDKDEAEELLGWHNLLSGGILIRYPENGAILVRLDKPVPNEKGKSVKYLGPSKQHCALFNPDTDIDLENEIWITEGPLKAICGVEHDIPMLALAGLWNWLDGPDNLSDEERLLPELKRDWTGKTFVLLTDSDIVPGHRAYEDGAFQRLARALYYYGAEEVRIVTLPDLTPDEIDSEGKKKKTGLDEFIIARGDQAISELRDLVDKTEPHPYWTLDRKVLIGILESPPKDLNLLKPPYYDVLINDYIENKNTFLSALWVKVKKASLPDLQGLKDSVKRDAKHVRGIRINGEPIVKENVREKSQKSKPVESGYEIPAKLLEGTTYEIIDKKLWKVEIREKVNSKGETLQIEVPDLICHFAIWPVRKIHKNTGDYLELEGKLPDGRKMKRVAVSMNDFYRMEWPGKVWHAEAEAIEPRKREDLRVCLALMCDKNIPNATVYTKTGWEKDENGNNVFLFANGAVGDDYKNPKIEVELSSSDKLSKLSNYRMPLTTVGDPKKAFEQVIYLLDNFPARLVYPSLGMVGLAPLTSAFNEAGYPPLMVFYPYGDTNSLKSSWMALILCFFGTFNLGTLPASFRGTKFSVEEMGNILKDVLFVVDDLKKTKDSALKQKMFTTLGELLRVYGDHQDRSRMESKKGEGVGLQESRRAGGLLAVTGEYSPTDGSSESDLARMFSVHINRGDIDLAKLTEAQSRTELLSQAMVAHLERLAPLLDILPDHLSKEFIDRRTLAHDASKVDDRLPRLNSAVAHLYIGFKALLQSALFYGAMTEADMNKHLDAAWLIFNTLADDQTAIGKKHDMAQVLLERTFDLAANNLISILPMGDTIQPKMCGIDTDINPLYHKTIIGYGPDMIGETKVRYMCMTPWVKVANTLQQGVGEINNQLTVDGVLDALERKKMLVLEDEKGKLHGRQFAKWARESTRHVAAIKEEFFQSLVE